MKKFLFVMLILASTAAFACPGTKDQKDGDKGEKPKAVLAQ